MARARDYLQALLPPVFVNLARQCRFHTPEYGFTGAYATWTEARRASVGYDAPVIVDRVLEAALRVKRGEAAYERDAVVFPQIQYSWPLLAGLMWAAAGNRGELRVLDYGGALGTTYFQNRRFLQGLSRVSWNIVEQPHMVAVGRRHMQDEILRFHETLEACCAEGTPSVAVFGSVLQYLEHPRDVLTRCFDSGIPRVIIDRTPCHDDPADRICVQRVPPAIYPASYPARIFAVARLREFLGRRGIVAEFDDPLGEAIPGCHLHGFLIGGPEPPKAAF